MYPFQPTPPPNHRFDDDDGGFDPDRLAHYDALTSAQDANPPRKGTSAGDSGKIRGDTPEPTEGTSAMLEGTFEAKHRKMTQI